MGLTEFTRECPSLGEIRGRKSSALAEGAKRRATAVETAAYLLIFSSAIAILYYGSSVLMPLALAGLLSFVLTPPIRYLKKAGLPKMAAVMSAVSLLSLLAIAGAAFIVGEQISNLMSEIPNYEYNLLKKFRPFVRLPSIQCARTSKKYA